MKSKIKALSLAILAIAAMSMVAASAAHAATSELHVTGQIEKSFDLTGKQGTEASEIHVFTLTKILNEKDLATKCKTADFEGTNEGVPNVSQVTASEVTVTGTYTECQSTGPFSAAAQVKMNGCKYTITDTETSLTAKVDITSCTLGKKIEVNTEGCTITVPEQATTTGHLTFTNSNQKSEEQDVQIHITVENITYETEGTFCILGKQEHQNGDYTGTATFKAFKDTKEVKQITHEGHQYDQLVCGAQKGLFAT